MYQLFNKFILRTPNIAFNQLNNLLYNKKNLIDFLKQEKIQEAIFIASPSIYYSLQKSINKESLFSSKNEKLLDAIVRYLSRMCTNCTPFGLFASCACGEFKDKNSLFLSNEFNKEIKLDASFLYKSINQLSKQQSLRKDLIYFPNTSLYKFEDKYRYIEYKYLENYRSHEIVLVENNEYLELIIEKSKNGIKYSEIIDLLINDDICEEDAYAFVNSIIDSQFIVSNLEVNLSGESFDKRSLNIILSSDINSETKSIIKNIAELFSALDKDKNNISIYEEIKKLTKQLDNTTDNKYLFQVNQTRNTSKINLNNIFKNDILDLLILLDKIPQDLTSKNQQDFVKKFEERYQYKEIPLLEVLDPELGIGYPINSHNGNISPLLNNIAANPKTGIKNHNINDFELYLLNKITNALTHSEKEVLIDNDLPFTNRISPMISSFNILFSIIGTANNKPLVSLSQTSTSSAANLFSRFANLDNKIKKHVLDITKTEQQLSKDAIIAELIHVSKTRVGNITNRPDLREYEIPFLTHSLHSNEKTIFLSDIKISIRNNRIILKSKKLNKEIIPRNTNAHNYRLSSTPIYQFLCDIQCQNTRPGLWFSSGNIINNLDYKPRIRYKNFILEPAIWNINQSEIGFININKDDAELIEEIRCLRKRRNIPRRVLLVEDGNELFIDLESIISIKSIRSNIKGNKRIKLKEFLLDTDNPLVKGEDGCYNNEFIVSAYKTN
jgi:hypothetical protein